MPVSGGRYPTQIAAHVLPLDHGGPVDVPFELFTDDWIDRPVFERFEYIVERYGDRIALDDGLARYNYDELMRASARLAQRIDALAPSRDSFTTLGAEP